MEEPVPAATQPLQGGKVFSPEPSGYGVDPIADSQSHRGINVAPMASTLRVSALSLAALRLRLACTLSEG